MKEGGIPKKSRRVIENNLEELLKDEKYDYIFMLGVTTYLSREQLDSYIKQIKICSKNGTKIIISYTLKNHIHVKWRKFLTVLSRTILKPFLKRKKLLINSGIQMTLYKPQDCLNISKNLKVYDYNFQNIFLPPFDRIFPRVLLFSIDKVANRLMGQNLIRFLGSDLSVKYIYEEDI